MYVDEILQVARIGKWNIATVIVLLITQVIIGGTYAFYQIVFGKLNFKCTDGEGIINECYYKIPNSNSTGICTSFSYYPGKEFSDTLRAKFNLVCEREHLAELEVNIMFIGQLLGSVFGAILIDYFGRKFSLVMGGLANLLCSFVYFMTPNLPLLIIGRFFESFFNVVLCISGFIYLSEVVPSKYAVFGSSSIEASFGIGAFLSGLISLIVKRWDMFIIFRLIMPYCILIVSFIFIDESPKWLLQKRRTDDFKKVIYKMFRINGTKMSSSIASHLNKIDFTENQANVNLQFWQLFQTKRTAFRMIALTICWLSAANLYYALIFGPDLFHLNVHSYIMISGLSEVPATVVHITSANKFGRKFTHIMFSILSVVFLILGVILPHKYILTKSVIACFNKLTATVTYLNIHIWNAELMPTPLRAIGMGLASITGRILAILLPQLILNLSNVFSYFPVIFFLMLGGLATAVALFIPETKNEIFPETIEDYENFGQRSEN